MNRVQLGSLWEVFMWLLGFRQRYKVFGKSMLPTLLPEDEILIKKQANYAVGNIIIVEDPQQPAHVIIKRIRQLSEGSCYLMGDNELASTDSRHWGEVSQRKIIGRVTCRLF